MYQDLTSRQVFCTVRNDRQAAEIVRLLKGARFTCEEISVFFPTTGKHREPSEETLPELREAVRALPRHLVSALIRMGVPEYEANRFATRLSAGEILVAIDIESDADVDRVCEIFDVAAAEGIVIVPRFKFAAAVCMADSNTEDDGVQILSDAASR
jgi:hypothetical protein